MQANSILEKPFFSLSVNYTHLPRDKTKENLSAYSLQKSSKPLFNGCLTLEAPKLHWILTH